MSRETSHGAIQRVARRRAMDRGDCCDQRQEAKGLLKDVMERPGRQEAWDKAMAAQGEIASGWAETINEQQEKMIKESLWSRPDTFGHRPWGDPPGEKQVGSRRKYKKGTGGEPRGETVFTDTSIDEKKSRGQMARLRDDAVLVEAQEAARGAARNFLELKRQLKRRTDDIAVRQLAEAKAAMGAALKRVKQLVLEMRGKEEIRRAESRQRAVDNERLGALRGAGESN